MNKYKQCTSCSENKALLDFYRQASSRDGYRAICKDCFNIIRKRSYQKNKQKVAKYGKVYRSQHREQTIAATRRWRQENKDKYLLNIHRRRLRMREAKTFLVSKKDLARLLTRPCIYCGNRSEHLDHIIPISRGGDHSIGNLAPSCANCNRSKSNKFITEWKMSQANA